MGCLPALGSAPLDVTAGSLIQSETSTPLRERIDSAHRELVLVQGPFTVAALPLELAHMPPMMGDHDSVLYRFAWPLDARVNGFRLELRDSSGHALPTGLLHHVTVVNLDRRELLYPIAERLVSFGKETGRISLPATVGIPLTVGQRLSVYAMWDNRTGKDFTGAYLVLRFHWASPRQVPAPIEIYPLFADANRVAGGHDMFDVPPGGCLESSEFTVPVAGRLLAAGGHLHDHGVSLLLEDLTTGKVLARISGIRDSGGSIMRVSRHYFGLWGPGLPLRTTHRYRLTALYENPGADTLRAVMGYFGGLFAPDDPRQFPVIDPTDPVWRLDMQALSGPVYRPGPQRGMPCTKASVADR